MRRLYSWAAAIGVFCAVGFPAPLLADVATDVPAATTPDATAEAMEALQRARQLLRTGAYDAAIEAYDALVRADVLAADLRTTAAVGLSRAYQQRGLWDASGRVVADQLKSFPETSSLLARQAELQFLRGDLDAAAESVARALALEEEQLLARLLSADLAAARGDYEAASDGYRWFVRYYNRVQPTDADSLLLVGAGSLQYARWKSVSSIFDFVINTLSVDALADDPSCWQASLMAGELLLEKYNRPQAQAEFAAARAVNPRAAEVLVAEGVAAMQDHDVEEAIDFAKRALEINPALPAALQLAADASVAAGDLKAAMVFIEQARKVNPVDPRTLALLAGVLLLDDGVPGRDALAGLLAAEGGGESTAKSTGTGETRFVAVYRDVLSRNPRPGLFLTAVGEILDGHRKYDAAEVCFRRAIEVMPQLSSPRTSLGLLAMRTGDLDEARSILDAAFKADPYHVRVSNMRKVLKQLDDYETLTSEHFVIRVPPDQRVLGESMQAYLEETYRELTSHFGFEPETRTQFEVYGSAGGTSAHQWFSARMVGLPWVQTIGASTGMIVALASPNDSPVPFNWARVLRHEYVHILTLQQTRFNIPHWYTEALAVRAEGVTPLEWDALLLRRVPAGEVFTLSDLNAGFQRPEGPDDWQMAYAQSWLYAEYLAARFGEAVHGRLLAAYQRSLTTPLAIEESCGVSPEECESGYVEYVAEYVAALRAVHTTPPLTVEMAQAEWRARPTDREAQAALAWAMWHADRKREGQDIATRIVEESLEQPLAVAIVAEVALQAGDLERAERLLRGGYDPQQPHPELLERLAKTLAAREEWREAADIWTQGVARWPRDPRFLRGLAAALLRAGDDPELVRVLGQLAALDADDLLSRKKLATLAHAAADWEPAIRWAREALQIDVTDERMHRILVDAFQAVGDEEGASRAERFLHALTK